MKSAGKINSPALTDKSSSIPQGYFSVLSTNYRIIEVAFGFSNPSFMQKDGGIKLILVPELIKVLMLFKPIEQGKLKFLGFFSLDKSLCYIIALHSSVKATVLCSGCLIFLVNISFINLK